MTKRIIGRASKRTIGTNRMRHWIINRVFTPVADKAGITCQFPDGTAVGQGTPVVTFLAWQDVFKIAMNPSIGFGEAWGHGRIEITSGDLPGLLQKLFSVSHHEVVNTASKLLVGFRQILATITQGWTPRQSKRNVHHHYDIGNDFYRLFLDDDWQYSCAYFDDASISLEEAQYRKKEHIARKLRLDGTQSVLDIGCGWGGMALHLAPRARSITGITLSEEQLDFARGRVRQSGDEGANISLEMRDYRQESRKFDRVVSVGMLEHVGRAQLPRFFRQVSQCLEEDGVALIHTIGRPGRRHATDGFISKYIFPGGYLPNATELAAAISNTDMVIADVETLFLHYAETLRHWRERFMANRHLVVDMYSEFFARIWELYLAGSESSFRNGTIVVYQMQLLKPRAERPFNRGYMYPPTNAPRHALEHELHESHAPEQGYSNLR